MGIVAKHQSLISLLCTIPDVDHNSAITIISEIGNDMSQFGSSKHLCCRAGLPRQQLIYRKEKFNSHYTSMSTSQTCICASCPESKGTDHSYYHFKCKQISKCRGKKHLIIAIVRMILTTIFRIMTIGEVWNPTDLFKGNMPQLLKKSIIQGCVKQVTKFLKKQGLTVS